MKKTENPIQFGLETDVHIFQPDSGTGSERIGEILVDGKWKNVALQICETVSY